MSGLSCHKQVPFYHITVERLQQPRCFLTAATVWDATKETSHLLTEVFAFKSTCRHHTQHQEVPLD